MEIKAKILADSIISPLGISTKECFNAIMYGKTALAEIGVLCNSGDTVYAAKIDREWFKERTEQLNLSPVKYTFFEQLAILSLLSAINERDIDLSGKDSLIILSTTKGNVDLLENDPFDPKLSLFYSAKIIAEYFGNSNRPVVISNACISGVSAIAIAKRYLQSGKYKRVAVVGADILSKFVVSGFQSFKALSQTQCRPFDKNRSGLNIGEGAAAIVFEGVEVLNDGDLYIEGEGIANDANHISGPSRTGEGLLRAINAALKDNRHVDFINTHGTATLYNDEMESIALSRAGLLEPPLSSFKGYFGHTLGAAGVIESVVCMESMRRHILIGTKGFSELGVTHKVNVIKENMEMSPKRVLKSCSGFGGSNAAIIISKQ